MPTAMNIVVASCHRLLLGRPPFARAIPQEPIEPAQAMLDAGSDTAGLALPALRLALHAQGARNTAGRAPQWG